MSSQHLTLLVPEDADQERLDRFLAEALPQYSREYLKTLIQKGCVALGGVVQKKPALKLSEGDEVTLDVPDAVPLEIPAENIPLEIVFEDDDVLVVNKPSGMLTHATGKEREGTLVNALLFHCKGNLSGINGVERPGIVHRLDRETSGLLMVAKSDRAHQGLQQQLHARTAKRCYRTIVQGEMPALSGTVNAPIDRNPAKRDKMGVIQGGRDAVTHWEVLDTIGTKFTILKMTLETGRTHQIRVHMAHIGHPIFADPLYGSGLENMMKYHAEGQILQAFQLTFTHPVTGETLTFEIPPDSKFLRTREFLETWIQQRP
jgi:23S rRNA pseudouridine1911/1915/1917 synthase